MSGIFLSYVFEAGEWIVPNGENAVRKKDGSIRTRCIYIWQKYGGKIKNSVNLAACQKFAPSPFFEANVCNFKLIKDKLGVGPVVGALFTLDYILQGFVNCLSYQQSSSITIFHERKNFCY